MSSTYSTGLRIELQATGANSGTWGTITNNNFSQVFEFAIAGVWYGRVVHPPPHHWGALKNHQERFL